MKWKSLQMPKKIELDEKTASDTYGKFTIEPLERGFGLTIGNALRRVLLSSLPGAAITAVKIDGALHEFSTLRGVLEDTAEIILNLKQVRFTLASDSIKRGLFEAKGTCEIVAGDLKVDGDVKILNPDLHIATLNKDGELKVEVEISGGRGYVPAENQPGGDRAIGIIPIDALFSPVTNVTYRVESARVGQRIDFDRLILEAWTDGSVVPCDALSVAGRILKDHFGLFVHFEEEVIVEEEETDKETERVKHLLQKSVDELELSVRSGNCLRAAQIRTLGELVQKSEPEMLKYRNFGRKSLKEILDILESMGLRFGMDVSKFKLAEAEQHEKLE
ncbi:MAG: DNA-directed RNA polymerase subunit alpha [Candidatus Eisenbacteria bacterium]|nr:DNA-directed RNA polymerase subunit alpha [Candidatus Eisenbacteria bacterium]